MQFFHFRFHESYIFHVRLSLHIFHVRLSLLAMLSLLLVVSFGESPCHVCLIGMSVAFALSSSDNVVVVFIKTSYSQLQ